METTPKNSQPKPKRRLLIAGLLALLVSVPLLYSETNNEENIFPSSLPASDTGASEQQSAMEGIAPGTIIAYKILSASGQGKAVSGKVLTSAMGKAILPNLDLSKIKSGKLIYTVEIEDPEDPMSFMFNIDPQQNEVEFSGRGLKKFTKINVNKDSGMTATKTDWSGAFKDSDMILANDLSGTDGVKIAFAGQGAVGDLTPDNPSLIKIQIISPANVGGGPTSAGVNEWSPTGPDELSHHDTDRVDANIAAFVDNYVVALLMMTEQFTAVMMQQMMIVGSFFDAKLQMETQMEMEALRAEAHRDYHPSEGMCRIGSFVKSLANAESPAKYNAQALSAALLKHYKGSANTSSAEGYSQDIDARLDQFRTVYCDTHDNSEGLTMMCDHDGDLDGGPSGGTDRERMNKDVNFARTIDHDLTLDIDLSNEDVTPDEEDVIALAKNLYWPRVLEPGSEGYLAYQYQDVMQARRIVAIMGVAHNSYAYQVGAKSRSNSELAADSGAAYMKSMMRELGMDDDEDIHEMLGDDPSYYAQMDVLTKKMFQNPNFYTNLYDKPVNVNRLNASMDAIRVMHGRDRYESLLRQEMLASLLAENQLFRAHDRVNADTFREMKDR